MSKNVFKNEEDRTLWFTDLSPAQVADLYMQLKKLASKSLIGIDPLNPRQKELAKFLREHADE